MKIKGFLKDVTGAMRVTSARRKIIADASGDNLYSDPIRELCRELHPEATHVRVARVEDASPTARKQAALALQGRRAPLRELPWSGAELGALMGKNGCSMLCFTDLALAERFAAALAETYEDWQETARLLGQRSEKAKRRRAAPRKHQPSDKRRI